MDGNAGDVDDASDALLFWCQRGLRDKYAHVTRTLVSSENCIVTVIVRGWSWILRR